jgi:hypothetical protein
MERETLSKATFSLNDAVVMMKASNLTMMIAWHATHSQTPLLKVRDGRILALR